MARHAAHKSNESSRARSRALLRAGLTVTAASAALGVGGAGAAAAAESVPPAPRTGQASPVGGIDTKTPVQALATALQHSTMSGLAPVGDLQLDPLANTGVDPLDNSLATQAGDFDPVSTAVVTGPLARGGSLADVPVAGGLLPR